MKHEMRLKDDPFRKIWDGKKTIELRLYDEKRRCVQVGDTIAFTRMSGGKECITVCVTKLHVFDSFETLYKTLPLEKCGYDPDSIQIASASDMNAYYSPEEQEKYGVVGIEFAVIDKYLLSEYS
jgi:ASC-1-like (ASCH) protein